MKKLRVFLDSSVLIAYFRKEEGFKRLFSQEVTNKVTYVINPVVFQELLLLGSRTEEELNFEEISKHVEILEIDVERSTKYLREARQLRNKAVHTNDLLIMGTAATCDYLLTYDKALIALGSYESVKVISPRRFFELLGEGE